MFSCLLFVPKTCINYFQKGNYVFNINELQIYSLNRHGRIQNILATHEYENTDWFFNMVLCVFMVKPICYAYVLYIKMFKYQLNNYRGITANVALE